MEYWVVYDVASGDERLRGSGPKGSAALQQLDDGLALIMVPFVALRGAALDLDVIRAYLTAKVDRDAEQVRLRFVTPGSGQGMTYLAKEAEARAYLLDSSTPIPFIEEEALQTDASIGDTIANVLLNADAWKPIGAKIEGKRRGAKVRIDRAASLGEIVAAAAVDWSAFGG